jgi:hypothetical protein
MEGRGCVVREATENDGCMDDAEYVWALCFLLKLRREVFPSLGTIPPDLYGGYILEIRLKECKTQPEVRYGTMSDHLESSTYL